MSSSAPHPTQLIGDVAELENGGTGLSFEVTNHRGERYPAFAIKYADELFAYLNICGHIAVPLDFQRGDFFTDDGQRLICSTHGAEYAPDTGKCLGGPCYGVGLEPLQTTLVSDQLFLTEPDFQVIQN